MREPGLDGRHRDKNGEISRKHGNTLLRTLRAIYGASFVAGLPDSMKLSDALATMNDASLSRLIRDDHSNTLGSKIQRNT